MTMTLAPGEPGRLYSSNNVSMAGAMALVSAEARYDESVTKPAMSEYEEAIDPLHSSQHHAHGNEPPLERIEHKADALQRSRPQQRLVSLFAKDHRGGATLTLQLEIRVAHLARDGRPV